MQDKNKLLKIYLDNNLDQNLLSSLIKARQLNNGEDHHSSILSQFTGNHASKILIMPRETPE